MKVLIADDSKLLRERIRALLERFKGVQVIGEAEEGRTAIQLAMTLNPDLIILDIRMPELNGIETLKELRRNGNRSKICILTNYPFVQYRDRCLAEGADYFFDKNMDFQAINDMVTRLCDDHSRSEVESKATKI